MTRMLIRCSKYEMDKIKKIFESECPFEVGTIKECGEDADCCECQEKNIKFAIVESVKEI